MPQGYPDRATYRGVLYPVLWAGQTRRGMGVKMDDGAGHFFWKDMAQVEFVGPVGTGAPPTVPANPVPQAPAPADEGLRAKLDAAEERNAGLSTEIDGLRAALSHSDTRLREARKLAAPLMYAADLPAEAVAKIGQRLWAFLDPDVPVSPPTEGAPLQ